MIADPEVLRGRVDSEAVQQALRTYEQWGGALRYLERDKWHVCDIQAMRKVLEEFAALAQPDRLPETATGGETE
jgi:hypothetical protein